MGYNKGYRKLKCQHTIKVVRIKMDQSSEILALDNKGQGQNRGKLKKQERQR